ncbi:hypothetical protein Tsubulata_051166 [Turnera subulata]|uniref:Uncharacterized protein n=1 Tax=Turnera subulata TaxID=218843 RepID=A0A9Q0F9K8_9ROSI|nr:hypothetical protein Tsubulata_051166 [Turnera subulata]
MEPIMEKKSAATATTTTTPPTTPRRRLCIGAEDGRGRGREWYTVDITEDDDREIVRCSCNCGCASCAKRMRHDTRGSPSLLPIAILKFGKKCRDAYNWAVLGDQLYVLALKKRRLSEFGPIMPTLLAFDLTDPSAPNQWMHKPDMLAPRSDSPSMVVVGGKLYALGGLDEDHYHCWAAVYDPTSDTWEDLPDPPFLPERGFYAASLEAEGKLMPGQGYYIASAFVDYSSSPEKNRTMSRIEQ